MDNRWRGVLVQTCLFLWEGRLTDLDASLETAHHPGFTGESCMAMAASIDCGWVLEEAQPGVSSKEGGCKCSFHSVLTRQQ